MRKGKQRIVIRLLHYSLFIFNFSLLSLTQLKPLHLDASASDELCPERFQEREEIRWSQEDFLPILPSPFFGQEMIVDDRSIRCFLCCLDHGRGCARDTLLHERLTRIAEMNSRHLDKWWKVELLPFPDSPLEKWSEIPARHVSDKRKFRSTSLEDDITRTGEKMPDLMIHILLDVIVWDSQIRFDEEESSQSEILDRERWDFLCSDKDIMISEDFWRYLVQVFDEEYLRFRQKFPDAYIYRLHTGTTLDQMIGAAFWASLRNRALCFAKVAQETIFWLEVNAHQEITRGTSSCPSAIAAYERAHRASTIDGEEYFLSSGKHFLHPRKKHLRYQRFHRTDLVHVYGCDHSSNSSRINFTKSLWLSNWL